MRFPHSLTAALLAATLLHVDPHVACAQGWTEIPGGAKDISVGADGSAWVIGTRQTGGGYEIYKWNGSNWGVVEGGAVAITVDPQGNAWVVNDAGKIYRGGKNAPPPPAPDAGVKDGGTYFIVARHSGKVLDVAGASTANGAIIQQWTEHGGQNQQFTFKRQADGTYRILAKHSGKCMYLPDGSSADGVEIQQYDCMDETYGHSAYQKFWVDPVGDGYVKIRTAMGKVIDIAGVATNDGAKLHQWEYVGGQNQQFKLERVEGGGNEVARPTFQGSSVLNSGSAGEAVPNGIKGKMRFRYTDQITIASSELQNTIRVGDRIHVPQGQSVDPAFLEQLMANEGGTAYYGKTGISFDPNAPKICGRTFTVASLSGTNVKFTEPLPENMRNDFNNAFEFQVILVR